MHRHLPWVVGCGVVACSPEALAPYGGVPDETDTADPPQEATRLRCGNEVSPDEWQERQDALAADPVYQGALAGPTGGVPKRGGRNIKVYFHVLHNGDHGMVYADRLYAQVDVLNMTYAYTGWRFELAGATWDDDPQAYTQCGSGGADDAIQALHQGTAADLNIYTCLPAGLLGYSRYPWDQALWPRYDGVVLDYETLPGGPAPYGEGVTATHEVGHWMGLFHTFEGGCDGGDMIGDTPSEAVPAWLCWERDTCPSKGVDPIENYMDYTGDACMRTFTHEQGARMDAMYAAYRAGR